MIHHLKYKRTISRMEDDERFVVLGITNVNEEMKQRKLAERMQERSLFL